MEIWKDVKGYEKYYQVSSFGRVKRLKSFRKNGASGYMQQEKILKPALRCKNNYYCVRLSKLGVAKMHSVHRLVAIAFIENNSSILVVNHKNGNKLDNSLENLEWVTRSENASHAVNVLGIKINKDGLKLGAQATIKKNLNITNGNKVFQTYEEIYKHVYKNPLYADRKKRSIQNGVMQCCTGKRKTSYGEKWEFVNNKPVSTISVSGE